MSMKTVLLSQEGHKTSFTDGDERKASSKNYLLKNQYTSSMKFVLKVIKCYF